MSARDTIGAEVRVLGSARVTHNDDTDPSVFDFGDGDLLLTPLLRTGDRILVVFHAASSVTSPAVISDISAAVTAAIALIGDDTATDTALDAVVVSLDAIDLTDPGTTDVVSFVVEDADDDDGEIGTPAAAATDGDLTGGTGDQSATTGIRLKSNRPWLRCSVAADGDTDTFYAEVTVLAIPGGV